MRRHRRRRRPRPRPSRRRGRPHRHERGRLRCRHHGRTPTWPTRAGGEVILVPAVGAEFDGSSLPGGWELAAWPQEVPPPRPAGQLTVDGGYARTTTLYGPGRVIEFRSDLQRATFQNAGLGVDLNPTPVGALRHRQHGGAAVRAIERPTAPSLIRRSAPDYFGAPHTLSHRMDRHRRSLLGGRQRRRTPRRLRSPARCDRSLSDFANGGSALSHRLAAHEPVCVDRHVHLARVRRRQQRRLAAAHGRQGRHPDAGHASRFEVRGGDTPTPDGSWSASPRSARAAPSASPVATCSTAPTWPPPMPALARCCAASP